MQKSARKVFSLLLVMSCLIYGWTSGEITVDVTSSPMDINVSAGGTTLANITAFTFGTVKYTAVSSVAETDTSFTLTLSSSALVTITGVDGGIRFKSTNPSVTTVMLTLKDHGEHFYGITEHNIATNPDLRGRSNVLDKITAYQRSDEDAEIYSGFYFTTLGYAGYFDGFAYGAYTFGVSGATTITYNTSVINWYLFYGPQLSKIQKSYYKIIGAPLKVPMWACGPLVWHDNYTGSAMILDHAEQFTQIKIPYSTIWLDRPYNNGAQGWSNMNFEGNFGNPGTWIKTLSDQYYVNLVTWIMPGVFDGTPPAGAFTSSPNQYLDLTDPAQVDWYRNKLKTGQYPYGIKGHKLDRVDNGWASGDLPAFKDGTPAAERHKKYAYLNCKISEEFLRVDAGLGDNCFLFPRCAVAGCQQYTSAIWNGDTYADWAGMVTSLGNAFRAGILAFPMWGSDICGYTQKAMPSIENYCRWLLFGVYSGFMELMLDGKEPWKLNATNQEHVRNIFYQRFTLLPYIYSILNTSAENGVTMMPLVGEYPHDPQTISIVDEYMFGPAMLVAPIASAATTRQLYLPAGRWIYAHNWADQQFGGAMITSPAITLDQIPVYIKVNSIYPTGKVFAGLEKKWDADFDSKRNIVINAFPGFAGDSATFTYVDYLDSNRHKEMKVSVSPDYDISITSPALTVPCTVAVRLWDAPISVRVDTTVVADPQYDATVKKLVIPFAANTPVNVTIEATPQKVIGTSRALRAQGLIKIRQTARGTMLLVPSIAGTGKNGKATISVFDLAGRIIVKQTVTLNHGVVTPVALSLSRGASIVQVDVKGEIAGRVKIMAP
ncbi:MAG: glycoside hydrolase family 31 protein [Chitinispirillaceae bacterium]|nr:glycoside hydrolase family 31 protein [Chitinispirillaceae bacterium]